jgi:AAA domain (dynein-related subfamily)
MASFQEVGILLQSAYDSTSVRQTVIIGLESKIPMTFTRIRKEGARGLANQWQFGMPLHTSASEQLITAPIAITWATNGSIVDQTEFDAYGSPRQFLQRANRTGDAQKRLAFGSLNDAMNQAYEVALTDPSSLEMVMEAYTPAGQQTPVAQPVAPVALPTPAPIANTEPTQVMAGRSLDWSLYIPKVTDPRVAGYINRTIGGRKDFAWADYAHSAGKNLYIGGPAGTGKTSFARAYASFRNLPFVVVNCTPEMNSQVVQGGYLPSVTENGEKTVEWMASAFAQALTIPSVILLNEASRMSAKSSSLFLSPLEERILILDQHQGEVIQRHPDCIIIADLNPNYSGVFKMDEAFVDRFNVMLRFDYDQELESSFITSKSLLNLATEVRNDSTSFRHTPFSTRLLKEFQSLATHPAMGIEQAIYNLVQSFTDPVEQEAIATLCATYEARLASEYPSN